MSTDSDAAMQDHHSSSEVTVLFAARIPYKLSVNLVNSNSDFSHQPQPQAMGNQSHAIGRLLIRQRTAVIVIHKTQQYILAIYRR